MSDAVRIRILWAGFAALWGAFAVFVLRDHRTPIRERLVGLAAWLAIGAFLGVLLYAFLYADWGG